MKIAIIPARGGSKRIPRKNIKSFANRPMIVHAIDVALRCNLFDRIVVSTDDEEIADIARKYGAEVPFMREAELADDHTPTVPVIANAISNCQALDWMIEEVCCIYPTVPFLQSIDLVNALNLLETNKTDYVFPVTEYPSAIQRAFRKLPNGLMESFYPEFASTRTQDLEPAFYDPGQFYWGHSQAWLEGKIIHRHGKGLVIPGWRVIDIDTISDWHRAELMYAAFNDAKNSI